jgi:hypothetical protein
LIASEPQVTVPSLLLWLIQSQPPGIPALSCFKPPDPCPFFESSSPPSCNLQAHPGHAADARSDHFSVAQSHKLKSPQAHHLGHSARARPLPQRNHTHGTGIPPSPHPSLCVCRPTAAQAAQRAKSKWAELINTPSSQHFVRSRWVNTPTPQFRPSSRSLGVFRRSHYSAGVRHRRMTSPLMAFLHLRLP